MSRLRVVIADDERPAREFLKSALRGIEGVEVIGEAEDGAAALDMIRELKPDLALLDLQMPEMSGLDVVRMLKKTQMPQVAFVTAFDEYAVKAFELNAIDYVLKPVERARLAETIRRAAERLKAGDWREAETEKLRNAAAGYDEALRSEPLSRIPVKKSSEIILVPVEQIVSIVADGELLRITTVANARHTINFRLKDLEMRLDPGRFVRLSRGVIVNIDMIAGISPMPGGTFSVTMKNGTEIGASRLRSRLLRDRLLKL